LKLYVGIRCNAMMNLEELQNKIITQNDRPKKRANQSSAVPSSFFLHIEIFTDISMKNNIIFYINYKKYSMISKYFYFILINLFSLLIYFIVFPLLLYISYNYSNISKITLL
jgi:hypothetical protein